MINPRLVVSVVLATLFTSSLYASPISDLFNERSNREIETRLVYEEKGLLWSSTSKLETIIYPASNPNGKLVLWQHGSVVNRNQLSATHRLLRIAEEFNSKGYTFVIWMRKGRGQSEGTADEFSGNDCNVSYIEQTLKGTESQTQQVIQQLKTRYNFSKVILVGHSRGGMVSAYYASQNPNDVEAVVNLAGGYALPCDARNNYNSRSIYERSAKFKKQKWIYFDSDTFFNPDSMNYIKNLAEKNSIAFSELKGNHVTPLLDASWVAPTIKWIEEK